MNHDIHVSEKIVIAPIVLVTHFSYKMHHVVKRVSFLLLFCYESSPETVAFRDSGKGKKVLLLRDSLPEVDELCRTDLCSHWCQSCSLTQRFPVYHNKTKCAIIADKRHRLYFMKSDGK